MHIELEPARELVAARAAAARTILTDAGAPNYAEIEMGFSLAGDPGRYAFILQRCGKLTPHQARVQAEERAAAAETERDQLRAELDQRSRRVSDHQEGRPMSLPETLGLPHREAPQADARVRLT